MQNKRVMQGFSFLAVAIVCNLIASARGCAETVVLPEMTVSAPGYPLSDRINNPQHLGEEDITVAHERSITDVIQGFPGVAVNRVGGFGSLWIAIHSDPYV